MFKKIQYKLGVGETEKWVHFCYVPRELEEEFNTKVNKHNLPIYNWIMKWGAEDYELDSIIDENSFEILKSHIQEQYRQEYPEIYLPSNTDSQGWLRVWTTKHMKKEIDFIENC